jgi:hypothetical protein
MGLNFTNLPQRSQFGLSGFQGEVISSSSFPNFVPAVQTRLAKVKFPEMHVLTNFDLLT